MIKLTKYSVIISSILLVTGVLSSCEEFFNPKQELNITEDKLYDDWSEYRSGIMGLYGLQQDLAEQLLVLGELRGDLLTITNNADADLVEIYNFEARPSKTNKYAAPDKFFNLIAASNRFISILREKHPSVLDKSKAVDNYDRLYGEALCARAWAYFNASRIYGVVPFIPDSLLSADEIVDYINSPATHKSPTTGKDTILAKQYYDVNMVLQVFTSELENKVKAVGVNHYTDNGDKSWEVTIWSTYSWHALLGQMYLTQGDLGKAAAHFEKIVYSADNTSDDYRYQLDQTFSGGQWANIFRNVNNQEHIMTLWFNKAYQQQNDFQKMFETQQPNLYQMKPTKACVHQWETVWTGSNIRRDYERPDSTKVIDPGLAGDWYRGYGISYAYMKNNELMKATDVKRMLFMKSINEDRVVNEMMSDVDTVVYKYSIGKVKFDNDANFIIYRAAGIHLYLAEIYANLGSLPNAVNILNDGSIFNLSTTRLQLGVRGRVGLGSGLQKVDIRDIVLNFDPFTNKYVGFTELFNSLEAKKKQFTDQVLDERARELAFEGERFYDLMRVAKRRNDPSYLASRVSAKYPEGMRQQMFEKLKDPNNWYIHYFD